MSLGNYRYSKETEEERKARYEHEIKMSLLDKDPRAYLKLREQEEKQERNKDLMTICFVVGLFMVGFILLFVLDIFD